MHQSTLLQLIFIVIFIKSTVNLVECRPRFLSKRNNAETNPINLESADSDSTKDVSFDDYPLVVPKRAAMLLDRLMVALHHALEDDGGSPRKINEVYRDGSFYATTQTMGNQQEKGQNPGIAEEPENIEGGITGLPPGHFAVSGAELLLNDNENNGEDRTINVRNNNGQHEQHHSHHHPGVVDDTMDLQRRGHGANSLGPNKGRVYWRCYFNAVTCF